MNRLFLLPFFLTIFLPGNVAGQTSKRESVSFHRDIFGLDTNEIRNGQHLSFARAFTIEKFVAYYLKNGAENDTKKYRKVIIGKLYRDNVYTYFGRRYFYGLIDFFKVENAALDNVPYEELDGAQLRQKFIDEIIPASDKERVARRMKQYLSLFENPSFNYKYSADSGSIGITYKWRIHGDFGIRVINKTYKANYDIAARQLKSVNTTAYNPGRSKKS